MACAAILDPNGADDAYAIVLKQAALGREVRSLQTEASLIPSLASLKPCQREAEKAGYFAEST